MVTLLVANPTAHSGRAAPVIDRALELLDGRQLTPELLATLPEGRTVGALEQRLSEGDVQRVVFLGGDGTFAESAKGILHAKRKHMIDVPLGMLPMGTANDQARSFGLQCGRKALADNVDIIAAGHESSLDAGEVEAFDARGETQRKDWWFDSFGIGLSARVLAARNRQRDAVASIPGLRSIYRDRTVYAGAILQTLVKTIVVESPFSSKIFIDDQKLENWSCSDLVVKGTRLYGGEWVFSHDSQPDDGKFEVVIVTGLMDWFAAAMGAHRLNPLSAPRRQALGLPVRTIHRGATIEIRVTRPGNTPPLSAQIDGEEFVSADHYRIVNLPRAIRVITPKTTSRSPSLVDNSSNRSPVPKNEE